MPLSSALIVIAALVAVAALAGGVWHRRDVRRRLGRDARSAGGLMSASGSCDDTAGIDPRAPRFGASITSALLLIAVLQGLTGLSTALRAGTFGWFSYQPIGDGSFGFVAGEAAWALSAAPPAERILDPAFLLLRGGLIGRGDGAV